MANHELITFRDDNSLAQTAAHRWLDELASVRGGAAYCVAISGGRIAKKFFTSVTTGAKERSETLAAVHFFWADERCVPPADAESNFALAKENLLDPLQIPPDRIHRLRGEVSPERATAEAQAEICRIAPLDGAGRPILDLIFLGMGEDGHVASLFPDTPREIAWSRNVYVPVVASKPPPRRITITYPIIAAAKNVWVLASGVGKEKALRESLAPHGDTPLARVLQARDNSFIFSDVFQISASV